MGPLAYGRREEPLFLGRDIQRSHDFSPETAVSIDVEVREIVMRNYEKARMLLSENLKTLHTLAHTLKEREVLDGHEVDMIVQGKTLADIDEDRRKREESLKQENEEAKIIEEKAAAESSAFGSSSTTGQPAKA